MLAQDAQVERLRPSIVIARRPTAVRLPCMAAKGHLASFDMTG
jgi:hypothetical protein